MTFHTDEYFEVKFNWLKNGGVQNFNKKITVLKLHFGISVFNFLTQSWQKRVGTLVTY